MSAITTVELEEAAKEAAGNWREFDSFVWWRAREIEDAENHAIFYTHHRDSGLLAQSNADAITKALEPFTEGDDPDLNFESHNHWAVGHIDGFSLRVFRDGQITEAFRTYHELVVALEDYPVLDESDYSNREFEATLENIGLSARSLKHDFALPEGWESEVFSWFWEHNQSAVENRDDQGGWPSEDDLREAFEALEYEQID